MNLDYVDFSYFNTDTLVTNTHPLHSLPYLSIKSLLDLNLIRFHDNIIKDNPNFLVGDNIEIEENVFFAANSGNVLYKIGSFSTVNSRLPVNTIIGRYSSIASNLKRMSAGHPTQRFTTSMLTYYGNSKVAWSGIFGEYLEKNNLSFETAPNDTLSNFPIIIGNDVWIGENVTYVPKGVTVGDGAIVAANSLLTKDVPPYHVVGGNPARIVKTRFSDEIISDLLELKWWDYSFAEIPGIYADIPIKDFITIVNETKRNETIQPMKPNKLFLQDFLNEI